MFALLMAAVVPPMAVEFVAALMVGGVALVLAEMSRAEAKRLVLGLLIALFGCAVLLAGELVTQPNIGLCASLEPFGFWWYFWGCYDLVYGAGR